MKRTVWWYVLLVLISITVPGTAPAAIYLKLDDIDGESTAQGHEKWIEVHSFAFAVSVLTTTDGASGRERAEANLSSAISASRSWSRRR